MCVDQAEDFLRIESVTFGNHVQRAGPEVGQGVQTRAVRERRGVQDRIAGKQPVDVGVIRLGCKQKVAVREHCALGHTGCSTGIEEPCRIVGPHFSRTGARIQVQRVELLRVHAHHIDALGIAIAKARLRAGIFKDPGKLARMQFRVYGYCDQSRVPDGEKDLEILGAVLHVDRDALAGLQSKPGAQSFRELRHAACKLTITPDCARPERDRRHTRQPAGAGKQEVGDIHRRKKRRAFSVVIRATSSTGLPSASARVARTYGR